MVTELVTDPRAFIREQIKYRGVRTQSIMLFVIGLVFAAQHIGTYYQLGEEATEVYEVILIHITIDLVAPFLIWVGSTFAIAIAARLVAKRLTTGDIFRLSGWTFAPLLVAGLIQTSARLFVLRDAELPELGLYSQLNVEWDAYREYIETANSDPVFLVATAIAALFILYFGYLLSIVIEEVGEEDGTSVGPKLAMALSAIPVALCLGWLALPFVM